MSRRLIDGKLPVRGPNAKKAGRKPILELTPEIMDKAEAALRIGSQVLPAFQYQGIGAVILRQWILKGYENPDSVYGELIKRIDKSMAEWETRTLAAWDKAVNGRPAEYEREVVRDKKGNVVLDKDGNPMTQIMKDGEGRPIMKHPAIKPDWRAAMELMGRRKPKFWANRDQQTGQDDVMKIQDQKPESTETLTFQERVAQAMAKLDEDV